MPIHDWTRVDAGIFHAFQHGWISGLSDSLNKGRLPRDYYALPEQVAADSGPNVMIIEGSPDSDVLTAETDMEFYRRKQKRIVVRHVTGDRVVAMIEIVSPGNKSTRNALRSCREGGRIA